LAGAPCIGLRGDYVTMTVMLLRGLSKNISRKAG
jgi:hypothetical protein